MNIQDLDPWQQEIITTPGNILLISGRRIGKSEVLSIDAAEYAATNPAKNVLVISHSERQAYWLFEKILSYLTAHYKTLIMRGKNRPTKTQLKLKNKTIIRCLPTGETGASIRGIEADRIYPDECDYINQNVWSAITPMLATTGGCIRAGTTPNPLNIYEGYVYKNMFKNPNFKVWEMESLKVFKQRKISDTWTEQQRREAIEHINQEKKTMTKKNFMVEYMGKYVDDVNAYFPDFLLKEVCVLSRSSGSAGSFWLGVDVAGMGGDLTTYEIFEQKANSLMHMDSITEEKTKTTDVSNRIISMNQSYKFKGIGVDGAGVGYGVWSELSVHDDTKRITEDLSGAKRMLVREKGDKKERSKTTLKTDMYEYCKAQMEKGQVLLLNDDDVINSFRSVRCEIFDGKLKLYGRDRHIVDGVIRAVWMAKGKNNKVWIRFF